MIDLMCERNFGTNFWQSQGNGLTASDSVLTITGQSSQRYATYMVYPGQTLFFRVNARCMGAIGGVVKLEAENKGTIVDNIDLPVSPDYQVAEVSYTCPPNKLTGVAVMAIVANTGNATAATVSNFYAPSVRLAGGCGGVSAMRTLACGLIHIASSLADKVEINSGFINDGIASISATATTITIVTEHVYADWVNVMQGKRPLAFITPTSEGGAMLYTAGSIGPVSGSDQRIKVDIQLWDPSTKAVINPTTVANAYFTFEIKMP
ncbi:hypothetical protein [Erwinia phage Snitter]|nr:hypothetical protein [Erwinia phage Snitter]